MTAALLAIAGSVGGCAGSGTAPQSAAATGSVPAMRRHPSRPSTLTSAVPPGLQPLPPATARPAWWSNIRPRLSGTDPHPRHDDHPEDTAAAKPERAIVPVDALPWGSATWTWRFGGTV